MTAAIRQVFLYDPGNGISSSSPKSFSVSALPQGNVLAGSTLIGMPTCSNFVGIIVWQVNDSQNGIYAPLDVERDPANVSFGSYYQKNCAALSSTDTVTLHFGPSNGTDGTEDFYGMVFIEVTGVTATPLLDHKGNLQTVASTTADGVTSTALTCGAVAGILIAASYQTTQNGSTPFEPNAGTGFTSGGTGFVWSLAGPVVRVESLHSTNLGTRAATFTPSSATSDNYVTLAVALLETTTGAAALAGTPAVASAATGALSTGIALSGTPAASVAASGTLHGVSAALAGGAVASSAATAGLSTAIQAAGSASVGVAASSSFAVRAYRPSRVDVAIYKPSYDGQYWGRYPNGDKPQMAGAVSIAAAVSGALSTGIKMAGGAAAAVAASGALTTGGGGSLGAVSNFQLVNQGGTTNSAGTVTSPLMQQTIVWTAATGPVDHYQIIRRTNYGADVDYATVASTQLYYTDTACTNFFSAGNIDQGAGAAATGPTTVYDYDVVAVDASGTRGAKPAQFTMWAYRGGISGTATSGSTTTIVDTGKSWTVDQWVGYHVFDKTAGTDSIVLTNTSNTLTMVPGFAFVASTSGHGYQIGGDYFSGVGDLSFGIVVPNDFANAGGSPIAPHAFCLKMTHDATGSDNAALQRPSASPASFIYGAEIGAFNYTQFNQRPSLTNQAGGFALHHRGPIGDLAGPHTFIDSVAILAYGPTPVANTWATYKIPFSAIQCSSPLGGVTNFSGSITGSTLTVTSIASGPGIDNGCWITGTGVPTATYVNPSPSQTGVGTYTVAGAGIPVTGTVSFTNGQAWATNWYKGQYYDRANVAGNVTYLDDIGHTRS